MDDDFQWDLGVFSDSLWCWSCKAGAHSLTRLRPAWGEIEDLGNRRGHKYHQSGWWINHYFNTFNHVWDDNAQWGARNQCHLQEDFNDFLGANFPHVPIGERSAIL